MSETERRKDFIQKQKPRIRNPKPMGTETKIKNKKSKENRKRLNRKQKPKETKNTRSECTKKKIPQKLRKQNIPDPEKIRKKPKKPNKRQIYQSAPFFCVQVFFIITKYYNKCKQH